jgi:hypothetical protein
MLPRECAARALFSRLLPCAQRVGGRKPGQSYGLERFAIVVPGRKAGHPGKTDFDVVHVYARACSLTLNRKGASWAFSVKVCNFSGAFPYKPARGRSKGVSASLKDDTQPILVVLPLRKGAPGAATNQDWHGK